jgi:hypothetical protein
MVEVHSVLDDRQRLDGVSDALTDFLRRLREKHPSATAKIRPSPTPNELGRAGNPKTHEVQVPLDTVRQECAFQCESKNRQKQLFPPSPYMEYNAKPRKSLEVPSC